MAKSLHRVCWLGAAALLLALRSFSYGASGTEAAAFLEIPVGGGPAALGGAYSALAQDAYAPTWNPGGLGFVTDTEVAAQHLDYLQSINYEYASFVHPLGDGRACGGSIQYLGSGDINGTDINGNTTGIYTSHYVAYNLSYGQKIGDSDLSLGATGKIVNAAIADVNASAYAADVGAMYQPQKNLSFGLVLGNAGSKMNFGSQADPLPLALHAGTAYQLLPSLLISVEGVYAAYSPASLHGGIEWSPLGIISLRGGYRTDTTKGLGPIAGLTTGLALRVWGQELDYAWLPYGDLGNTQYVSIVIRFGSVSKNRNLIVYHAVTPSAAPAKPSSDNDYMLLMELLNDHDAQVTQTAASKTN